MEKRRSKTANADLILNTLIDATYEVYKDEGIRNKSTYVLLWLSIEMDAYFLLRLLGEFNEMPSTIPTQTRRSVPDACKEQNTIRNAIVYTGSRHSLVYVKFFELYFRTNPTIVVESDEYAGQCVSLIGSGGTFSYFPRSSVSRDLR
jgi:hypothetical protein